MTTLTTTGYGDIVPTNDSERVLNVFIMVVGATVFGYVVANVSTLVQSFNEQVRRPCLSHLSPNSLSLSHSLTPFPLWLDRAQARPPALFSPNSLPPSLTHSLPHSLTHSLTHQKRSGSFPGSAERRPRTRRGRLLGPPPQEECPN